MSEESPWLNVDQMMAYLPIYKPGKNRKKQFYMAIRSGKIKARKVGKGMYLSKPEWLDQVGKLVR